MTVHGSDGSEQNANICLYWLKLRCKSTAISFTR